MARRAMGRMGGLRGIISKGQPRRIAMADKLIKAWGGKRKQTRTFQQLIGEVTAKPWLRPGGRVRLGAGGATVGIASRVRQGRGRVRRVARKVRRAKSQRA